MPFPLSFDPAIPNGQVESIRLLDNRVRELKQQLADLLGIPTGLALEGAAHRLLQHGDLLGDWVVTGLLGADPGASLALTTPGGTAYIAGQRFVSAGFSFTYTASADTYDDLSSLGVVTHTAVANGAGAPAVAPNSIRLQKVVTNGTEITGVTDLRVLGPTVLAALTLTLVGDPVLPLQAATKQYVDAVWTTGDVKVTFKAVADPGWVLMNDGSIGNAASGATTRADADTEALFTLFWTNVTDTWAPVSGGRGASAAADFAANKTLTVPKALGRALAVAGTGAGLTSRALGESLGEEAHALTANENGPHTHFADVRDAGSGATGFGRTSGGGGTFIDGAVTKSSGSGTPHNTMQPTTFVHVMVKL